MDWSRAKTILIISFLFINIFLLIANIFNDRGGVFENDYIKYAEAYLSSRDVDINAKIKRISEKKGKIVYITRQHDFPQLAKHVFGKDFSEQTPTEDGSISIEEGDERLVISESELYIVDNLNLPDISNLYINDKKLEKELLNYLKAIGYKTSELEGGKVGESENTKEFEYMVKYKQNFIFDLKISISIDNKGKMALIAPNREVSKENGRAEILSPHQILVMAGLPAGSSVEKVDFGYKQISEGDLYGTPLWRVVLGDGDTIFFNAYTGEEV